MKKILIVSFLIFASAKADPRTWTATDGRTIKADFIFADSKTVKLARADTGLIVSIPLALLADADRAVIVDKIALTEANEIKLTEIKAAFPLQKTGSHGEWDVTANDCVQLFGKYQSGIKSYRVGTLSENLKMTRQNIKRDLEVISLLAQTATSYGKPSYKSTMAAQCNQAWLTQQLPAYLAKIEVIKTE